LSDQRTAEMEHCVNLHIRYYRFFFRLVSVGFCDVFCQCYVL
jgi:hypothetical protein